MSKEIDRSITFKNEHRNETTFISLDLILIQRSNARCTMT